MMLPFVVGTDSGTLTVVFLLVVLLPVIAVFGLVVTWYLLLQRGDSRMSLLELAGYYRQRLGVSGVVGAVVVAALLAGLVLAVFLQVTYRPGSEPTHVGGGYVLYALGVVAVGLGVSHRKRFRLLRRATPADTGGHVEVGDIVELEGEVAAYDGSLTAPLSRETAVAYRSRVDQQRYTGRGGNPFLSNTSWVPIDHDRDGVPFAVDDASGTALVDPAGGWYEFLAGDRLRFDGDGEVPEPVRVVIDRIPEVDESDALRLTERRLAPGDTVSVVGEVTDRRSVDGQVVPVVGGDGRQPIVATRGDAPADAGASAAVLEDFTRRVRAAAVYGLPGGAVAMAVGLGVMLVPAGVI